MPEMRFQIEWPDGAQELCYSPSLVIKEYFQPGQIYDLDDFVSRAKESLTIASDRVKAKYGSPCGLALGQLQSIEQTALQYRVKPNPRVQVLSFIE